MYCRAKYPIKAGKILIPKGMEGKIISLTTRVRESFPNLKESETGEMYLVKFEGVEEILVDKSQISI